MSSLNSLTANEREGHQDNNNDNVTRYLEYDKDNILDLAIKNYENLVEAVTNHAIDTAATFSNHTLSSLQSSSKFPKPHNQSDIFK
jgi:predicted nucleotide-binding protein (sugar kinase/HSP70/actin superfamily)